MAGSTLWQPVSPRQAILVQRVIWAALLVGQLAFLAVIWFLLKSGNVSLQPATGHLLFLVSAAMLAGMLPIAWLIRRAMIRPGSDGLVSTGAYGTGNIVFYAMCEGPSFAGLIGILLGGVFWPNLIVPLIAMAAQILHFPAALNLRNSGSTIE